MKEHAEKLKREGLPCRKSRLSFRIFLGTLFHDWPRFFRCMIFPKEWGGMRNRQDVLLRAPLGPGLQCDWEFTRPLHLCTVFPWTGRQLLTTALREHPIRFANAPSSISKEPFTPEVSFIIGHRGLERLPLLLLTLRSIAAQQGVPFECIVVEQDSEPRIRDRLPPWVRYLHTPLPEASRPFSRSWAFNEGAALARGHLLVFHDNDLLLPAQYAEEAVGLFRSGYEVIQMKRFIFYRSPLFEEEENPLAAEACWSVDLVLENALAGGSLAVARDTFVAIGGFDEEFVGWGGEDNELWDRCLTREVWPFGFLPLVHLWHAPQEGKRAVNGMGAHTADLTLRRRAMPPETRIAELKARLRGVALQTDQNPEDENGRDP